MSIATDVSRIKGNITAALAAIADKGVSVPDGSTSDALAELIASIEAGGSDVVLGEITFTSNNNVTLTDAFPARSQAPKAFFWFEKGLAFNNTTHTKRRPLALIAARSDGGTGSDTKGSYTGAYVESSSGSNSFSEGKLHYTNMFNAVSASTNSTNNILSGNYYTGTLYFGVKSSQNGFIEGRTYVWGVMPWDE